MDLVMSNIIKFRQTWQTMTSAFLPKIDKSGVVWVYLHCLYILILITRNDQTSQKQSLYFLVGQIYQSVPSFLIHNQITMGQLINRLLNSFADMRSKILMLGLDGAGKTTILYQMKLNEAVSSVPTVGFNVQEINYKGLSFTIWDIGGQTRLRELWHHYYNGSNAVIYVLDSADIERISLAKETLDSVINHPDMAECPVLVFANKIDITTLKPVEIVQRLGLYRSKRVWHLQPCCGLNGEGIIQGFEWLRKQVKKISK